MVKQWILNTFFKEELENATRAGSIDAFKKAHADITETMVEDIEKRANELADQKLSEMLSPVNHAQVVTLDRVKGIVFIGGERATEEQLLNLKSEVEFLESSTLWPLLYETPKKMAQDTIFVLSETLVDLQKGKSMLYFLSQQQNILNIFKNVITHKQ